MKLSKLFWVRNAPFRVTKDACFDVWYLHRKFLFWWVKYSIKTNVYTSIAGVRDGMLHGHYEFGSGEYADWWYISAQGLIKEEFYSCVQEFIDENAEHLI
jgi:hypothetical protein